MSRTYQHPETHQDTRSVNRNIWKIVLHRCTPTPRHLIYGEQRYVGTLKHKTFVRNVAHNYNNNPIKRSIAKYHVMSVGHSNPETVAMKHPREICAETCACTGHRGSRLVAYSGGEGTKELRGEHWSCRRTNNRGRVGKHSETRTDVRYKDLRR